MFLTSKTAWAGMVFTLLTTEMLAQGFRQSAAGSDSNKEGAAGIHQNEIKKMQETLRSKGQYRGQVDGVFGLRTRANSRISEGGESASHRAT
jgi:peptidoglycan hydrolase-like protein with peptidoglycan-binding domain